ncbi:MAG: sortase B protein-sorting domain-containing protein [Oscillospiraceae bacterium]|jgi:hypothetical protein|nr:sortase B protein-sorting domain-containing protein [Oscillospiraceae bacterium]
MKKTLSIILALAMLFCISITAFAAPGGFVNSPTNNSGPVLEDYSFEDGSDATLIVTPYNDRGTLPENRANQIKNAYDQIVANPDLTKLNGELTNIAEDLDIPSSRLAVGDLFDVRTSDDKDHGIVTVTLAEDILSKFVSLMVFDGTDWSIVDGATVNDAKTELSFKSGIYGSFAIVVDTEGGSGDNPPTGDTSNIWLYAILMAASALALIVVAVVLVRSKKKKA